MLSDLLSSLGSPESFLNKPGFNCLQQYEYNAYILRIDISVTQTSLGRVNEARKAPKRFPTSVRIFSTQITYMALLLI